MITDKWQDKKYHYGPKPKIQFLQKLFKQARKDMKGITLEVPPHYFSKFTLEGEEIKVYTLGTQEVARIGLYDYDNMLNIYWANSSQIQSTEFSYPNAKGVEGVLYFLEELFAQTNLKAKPTGTLVLSNEWVRQNASELKEKSPPDLKIFGENKCYVEVKHHDFPLAPARHIEKSSWNEVFNHSQREQIPGYLAVISTFINDIIIQGIEVTRRAEETGFMPSPLSDILIIPKSEFINNSDFFQNLEDRLS